MRDPKRIDKFCDELKTIWHCMPDMRFGQLMMNAMATFEEKTGRPWFYQEDEELMDFLREYVRDIPILYHKITLNIQ